METVKFWLVLLLIVTLPTTALGNPSEIKVLLNGQAINFDVAPDLKNGVTLVPLRGVFEAMGATVTWEEETRSIFISNGDKAISLQVGSPFASVNGDPKKLLRSPEIIKGRTLVPLRFVSEALGARINWNDRTRIITIETNPPEFSSSGEPIDKIELPPGFLPGVI